MTDERRPTKLISAEGHRKKSSGLSTKAQNTKLAAVLVGFQKKERYYGYSPRCFPCAALGHIKVCETVFGSRGRRKTVARAWAGLGGARCEHSASLVGCERCLSVSCSEVEMALTRSTDDNILTGSSAREMLTGNGSGSG